MADFLYRIPSDTEEVIRKFMRKNKGIKTKTKCLNFLIDSRPALDKELILQKKEIESLNKQVQALEARLLDDSLPLKLESILQELERAKREILEFRKQFEK